MSLEQYSSLATVYDALNFGCDYSSYSNYLANEIRKNEKAQTRLVLDLACGTGKLTLLLRELGYVIHTPGIESYLRG